MSYWFKPKTHGYGASRANWRGWVATAVFVTVLLGVSVLLLASQQNSPSGLLAWQLSTWAPFSAILALGFILLACAKTSGQWGWRWGK